MCTDKTVDEREWKVLAGVHHCLGFSCSRVHHRENIVAYADANLLAVLLVMIFVMYIYGRRTVDRNKTAPLLVSQMNS